jgi:hypothetical protein
MDEPVGFFPERRLMAYRRSLQAAANPGSAAPARHPQAFPGWLFFVTLSPSYVGPLCIGAGLHTPVTIVAVSACLLIACSTTAMSAILLARSFQR